MLRKIAFLLSLMLVVIAPLLATPLFAQIEIPPDAVWYIQLIGVLVVFALPYANRFLFEGLQSLVGVLQGLPAIAKQVLVVIQSFLLTHLAVWLGVPLPGNLEEFTGATTLAILTALAAMGIHKLAKDKEPVPA